MTRLFSNSSASFCDLALISESSRMFLSASSKDSFVSSVCLASRRSGLDSEEIALIDLVNSSIVWRTISLWRCTTACAPSKAMRLAWASASTFLRCASRKACASTPVALKAS